MSKKMDRDFPERLMRATQRARIAYSQSTIAALIGVNKQTVDTWMKGSLPRADKIFVMADRFDVDARWLATGEGDMAAHHHIGETGAPAYGDTGIKRASPTVPNDGEKLLALVRTFLDTDEDGRRQLATAAAAVSKAHAGATTTRRARRR